MVSQAVDKNAYMIVDRRAFKQIMLNLLSNAIKFTPDGGKITVRLDLDAPMPTLTVSDTGIGIPEDKLSKVLEPFGQASQELYIAETGTGLGLAIVKAMVEAHDGELRLESVEGRGTSVSIMLPSRRVRKQG